MSTIVTRAGKGTPLTNVELDANFTNLNADKAESLNPVLTNARSDKYTSTNPDGFRMKTGTTAAGYAMLLRNDGVNTNLLLTNNNDADGTFNTFRPFTVEMATGNVSLAGGALTVTQGGVAAFANSSVFRAAGGASEGGELRLEKPVTGASFTGDIVVDVAADVFRIFESGGTNRGASLTLTETVAGVGSKLYHQGFKPTKADVGLGNVDNTSDVNKPVSTAQAAADATKLNLTGGTLTGPLYPNFSLGIIGVATPGQRGLEVRNNGSAGDAAFMAFHRQGVHAVLLGLDTDNKFKVGGWSTGNVAYTIFHQGSILGGVSQSAGIPTGALIERGSNANGEYTRWADGTQICTRNVQANLQSPTVHTWAASFSASPAVSTTNDNNAAAYASTIAITNANFQFLSSVATNSVNVIAIGRWF